MPVSIAISSLPHLLTQSAIAGAFQPLDDGITVGISSRIVLYDEGTSHKGLEEIDRRTDKIFAC